MSIDIKNIFHLVGALACVSIAVYQIDNWLPWTAETLRTR